MWIPNCDCWEIAGISGLRYPKNERFVSKVIFYWRGDVYEYCPICGTKAIEERTD